MRKSRQLFIFTSVNSLKNVDMISKLEELYDPIDHNATSFQVIDLSAFKLLCQHVYSHLSPSCTLGNMN